MKTIQADALSVLPLGRQGEHLARRIVFDLSEWVREYGAGTAELIYQRPGDASPYPLAVLREGNALIWTPTATDTAVCGGYGKCELRYFVADAVVKSEIRRTWVDRSMDADVGAAPPEGEKSWVDLVLEAGTAARDAAARAEAAAVHQPYPNPETATWWVWDAAQAAYTDSGEPTRSTTHGELALRDAEDQHPIRAITDLSRELNACVKTGNVITALDITKMMGE